MGKYDDDDNIEDISSKTSTKTRSDDDGEVDEVDEGTKEQAKRVIRRGWAAADEVKSADSKFATRLKVESNEKIIVKFLEDEPYTSYKQHWIERQGQKSFTCTANLHAKGCPLCDAGDRPSSRFCFNVALLSENDEPVIRSYEVGPRVIDSLQIFHTDSKMGPLTKHYWAISKTGKGGSTQTNHQMVKASDLEEDYSIDPLTDTQLAKLTKQCYDSSIVAIPSYQTLQGIASEELA
jgi:hypothetical protein